MERNKRIMRTSIIGIWVNIFLVVFKAIVGSLANSISISLDALNNLTDAFSSTITIIGTLLSSKKPDKKHPFGHGRIEYFVSIIIAIFIFIAGMTALRESFQKIRYPEIAEYSIVSLLIVAIAVIVKVILGRYVKKVGESIQSQSLKASGTDALMDAVLSFSILVAAIISYLWHISLEGYLGVVVGIIIIKSSIGIFKETMDSIIGIRADEKLINNIKKEIASFEEVRGMSDLYLHSYGPQKIVASVHIQVMDDMRANEIHILSRKIISDILEKYGIILTVGIYAINSGEEYKKIKENLIAIIKEYSNILQMHGFYVDKASNTILFDLILDFGVNNPEEIKREIINRMSDLYPEYSYSIVLDTDVSE